VSTYLNADTIADAWIKIMGHLLNQPHGKCFHLITTIANPAVESTQISRIVDLLADEAQTMSTMENANTIWPHILARPGKEFDVTIKRVRDFAVPLIKVANNNRKDSYVERLVAWRGKDGGERVSQLENVIGRMRNEVGNKAPKSSSYEIAIFSPGLDAGYMGFPCLSHLSFKLDAEQEKIHLTALYRNHHFVTHGYGNFLGLGRLMKFVAVQVGYGVGELVSVSTHADAELELGKARIEKWVREAKKALDRETTLEQAATIGPGNPITAAMKA
jgi:thymidylate synthase